jgi:hypothetical protein
MTAWPQVALLQACGLVLGVDRVDPPPPQADRPAISTAHSGAIRQSRSRLVWDTTAGFLDRIVLAPSCMTIRHVALMVVMQEQISRRRQAPTTPRFSRTLWGEKGCITKRSQRATVSAPADTTYPFI